MLAALGFGDPREVEMCSATCALNHRERILSALATMASGSTSRLFSHDRMSFWDLGIPLRFVVELPATLMQIHFSFMQPHAPSFRGYADVSYPHETPYPENTLYYACCNICGIWWAENRGAHRYEVTYGLDVKRITLFFDGKYPSHAYMIILEIDRKRRSARYMR